MHTTHNAHNMHNTHNMHYWYNTQKTHYMHNTRNLLHMRFVSGEGSNVGRGLSCMPPLLRLTGRIPFRRDKKYQNHGCSAQENKHSCFWDRSARPSPRCNSWKDCWLGRGRLHTSTRTNGRTLWGRPPAMRCSSCLQRVLADTPLLCASDAHARCNACHRSGSDHHTHSSHPASILGNSWTGIGHKRACCCQAWG